MSQENNPSVTVVIPVHNHAGWVNDAIDSVASQDYRPLRIVVVDDGSTDGSSDAVLRRLYKLRGPAVQGEPFAALGKLTKWGVDVMVQRFKEARGPAFARNWGMRIGWEGTDIFGLLDSDDLYSPGKVSRSVAKFVECPEHVGVVYSDYDTLRPDGVRLRQYKEPFDRFVLLRECIVNCDSLVSKKAVEACGLMDEEMRVCEDYDWWVRISERFMLVHLPESLVTVRVGEHSSTSSVPKEVWQWCYQRVMNKARERARQ